MPAVKTVKIHDPRNPRNIIQVNEPEIIITRPAGHDEGPTFDPLKHVKVRPQGERYTVEEEQILAQQQSAFEKRRAELRAKNKEQEPQDEKDALIARLQRELDDARAANRPAAAKEEHPQETKLPSTSPKAPQEAKQGSKKPAAAKEEAGEDTALMGLSGAPEAAKK